MRAVRIKVVIFLFGAIAVGLLILSPLLESHYIQLQHKSPKFYARLAAACDSILAKYPVSTNKVIQVPVTDPSLPDAVKDMHPLKLRVKSQSVWMLLDSNSRAGIGLWWSPTPGETNVWQLGI